jgi:hypothetical protein
MSGKDSSRDGKWKKGSIFTFAHLDETGVLNVFETSQDKVTPPTLTVDNFAVSHPTMKTGIILRIHYRLNPTAAVTYTLRLWRSTGVDPYELNLYLLYESPAAQADDTDYDREVRIPMTLWLPGVLYYSIEWTGAPGNTTGFIEVTGEKVD